MKNDKNDMAVKIIIKATSYIKFIVFVFKDKKYRKNINFPSSFME